MPSLLLALALIAASEQGGLGRMSLDAVLSCAGDAERCHTSEWDLARELARRNDTGALIARLRHATRAQRRVLVFALYLGIPTSDVTNLMRRLSRDTDEEIAYYALNYQAKLCDKDALAMLVEPPYRARAACEQWATTVGLVGHCRFSPGGPFLLASLDHACLNVVRTAETGLRRLYPGAPANFGSLEEEKRFFSKKLRRQR